MVPVAPSSLPARGCLLLLQHQRLVRDAPLLQAAREGGWRARAGERHAARGGTRGLLLLTSVGARALLTSVLRCKHSM